MRPIRVLCSLLLLIGLFASKTVAAQLTEGSRMIEANGIDHWVKIAGTTHRGVPLVIIHGGPGGNNFNYERTIGPRLEAFTPVIYYEQRGSGRSEAPADPKAYSISLLVEDLEALRTKLSLEKMNLLGYSFGAELALQYTLKYSSRVKQLILQSPTFLNEERTSITQLYGFRTVAEGELRSKIDAIIASKGTASERLDRVWNTVDTETVDRFLFHNQRAAAENRALWGHAPTNTGLMARALAAQHEEFGLARAAGVHAPTLILTGFYDRNGGVEASRDLNDTIPGSRMEIFWHSAHFPDMEEPKRYADLVRRFIQNR